MTTKRYPPADELNLLKGKGLVPADNVGCFLRLAQFDVIVPGSFDFYFGPERLRELKGFIESTETIKPDMYSPVRVLGSNLTMAPVHVDPNNPPNATGDSKAKLGNLPGSGSSIPEAVLPTVVLPWMRAVRVKNAIGPISPAPFNPAAMPDLFDDDSLKCFKQWLGIPGIPPPAPSTCSAGNLQLTGKDKKGVYTFSKNYLTVKLSSDAPGFNEVLSPALYSQIGADPRLLDLGNLPG